MSTSPKIQWGSDGVTINGETNLLGENISIGTDQELATTNLLGEKINIGTEKVNATVTVTGDINVSNNLTLTGAGGIIVPSGGITVGSAPNDIELNYDGTVTIGETIEFNPDSSESTLGNITATSITMGNTTFNKSGTGQQIDGQITALDGINIGSAESPQIQLNSNGSSTFTGTMTIKNNLFIDNPDDGNSPVASIDINGNASFTSMTINNNNNDSETEIFVVGTSPNSASITNKGNGTFNNSVSAQSINAMTSLKLKNTTVNSITTGTSVLPDSPDTSIPTVGYLSKVVNSQSSTEPVEITSTTGTAPNPTYSYQIVMWIKNADTSANSNYFGKKYSYTYDDSQQKYVFSETAVTGTGTYPW